MKFTKMHGLGNDYLYVYSETDPENPGELSIKLSDRHFGAGSDGMIWILPSDVADFKMRMFNADGSEGKMCGNGIRCVGKYVYDKGYTEKKELLIETLSGIKRLKLCTENGKVSSVTVDMGKAGGLEKKEIKTSGGTVKGISVSTGNPHFVIFCGDIKNFSSNMSEVCEKDTNPEAFAEDVSANNKTVAAAAGKDILNGEGGLIDDGTLKIIGSEIEHSPEFPEGVNVEFVSMLSDGSLRMRVWERGSGITMACGTGACATAAAAVKEGIRAFDENIKVALDGGILNIKVKSDHEIEMTGPAAIVYDAETVL